MSHEIISSGNFSKRIQILLVYFIVLLTYIGLSLPYTIFPTLLIGDKQTSHLVTYGLIIFIYPIGQSLGMVLFGYLSDFYGRKFVLNRTLIGAIVTFIGSGITVFYKAYVILIIIRFFCGMFEGNVAIALAAVSDMSNNAQSKTKLFGRVNIALTLGFMLGPLIGSFFSNSHIVSWFNESIPFFLAAFLSFFIWLAVKFFFIETYQHTKTISHSQNYLPLFKQSLLNVVHYIKKPVINKMLFINLLITMSIDIVYQFMPVYLVHRWQATSEILVIAIFTLSIGKILGNGYLINYINTLLKVPFRSIFLGLAIIILSLSGLMYVSSIISFLGFIFIIGIFISVAVTNTLSRVSIYTSQYQQGRAMSAAQSMRMLLSAVICNIAALSCYISFMLPFIMSTLFAGLALMSLINAKKIYQSTKLVKPKEA